MRHSALAILALLTASACSTTQSLPPRPAAVTAPPPVRAPAPDSSVVPSLMGQTASGLQSLFGRPTLDIEEGYARKLQFANGVCVLDAYLYPRVPTDQMFVTHVDTRRPDGSDMDTNACVAALTRRTP